MAKSDGTKKPGSKTDQVERSKRGAAGQANSTKGRSRVFKDKTKYDRKKEDDVDT